MNLRKAMKVVDAVEAKLSGGRSGSRMTVLREFTRIYVDSMTIVIDAKHSGGTSKFVDRLIQIEQSIEKEFKIHVLIVPAHPEVCDVPKRIGVPRSPRGRVTRNTNGRRKHVRPDQ